MNIKAGDAVVLKDWEELNHDGSSWYGISKETYNELKMKVRVVAKIDVSYNSITAIVIEKVYAVDNRRGLKREYQESIKAHTIASQYEFKDLLEREGIVVG